MTEHAERVCGTCTLCCKVMRIEALQKPQGEWCPNCAVGKGCKIYSGRPIDCQNFSCGYLSWEGLPEYWFPARSKMVVATDNDGRRLAVHVDPSMPASWRAEPYYSDIKSWAADAVAEGRQVIVGIKNRQIVIFPDRDVDLGPVAGDEGVVVRARTGPGGTRLEAAKVKIGDPRVAGMTHGRIAKRDAAGSDDQLDWR
jgi:hypothetical protein